MWGGAWIEATEANCRVSEMDSSDPWSSWANWDPRRAGGMPRATQQRDS